MSDYTHNFNYSCRCHLRGGTLLPACDIFWFGLNLIRFWLYIPGYTNFQQSSLVCRSNKNELSYWDVHYNYGETGSEHITMSGKMKKKTIIVLTEGSLVSYHPTLLPFPPGVTVVWMLIIYYNNCIQKVNN